ncbi:MAG: hypothetical protein AB8G86_05645, partial [Saprospiraceae bacterium]
MIRGTILFSEPHSRWDANRKRRRCNLSPILSEDLCLELLAISVLNKANDIAICGLVQIFK